MLPLLFDESVLKTRYLRFSSSNEGSIGEEVWQEPEKSECATDSSTEFKSRICYLRINDAHHPDPYMINRFQLCRCASLVGKVRTSPMFTYFI